MKFRSTLAAPEQGLSLDTSHVVVATFQNASACTPRILSSTVTDCPLFLLNLFFFNTVRMIIKIFHIRIVISRNLYLLSSSCVCVSIEEQTIENKEP